MPYHFGHRHEFYLDATASWLAQRRARAPRPRRVRAAGTPGNSGFFFSPASTLVSSSCSAPKPLRACQAGVRGRAPPHLSWNPGNRAGAGAARSSCGRTRTRRRGRECRRRRGCRREHGCRRLCRCRSTCPKEGCQQDQERDHTHRHTWHNSARNRAYMLLLE